MADDIKNEQEWLLLSEISTKHETATVTQRCVSDFRTYFVYNLIKMKHVGLS